MYLSVFHVDAFTNKPFGGNPAAVCPLTEWLDDDLLRAVALENNLSETAYLVPRGDRYDLRWFTPCCEVQLCGHATLASALVVMQTLAPGVDSVRFETRFSGRLTVVREDDLLAMDFPRKPPWECPNPPEGLLQGLGSAPRNVIQIEDNYFAVFDREEDVRRIRPDLRMLEKLHPAGVAITAPGEDSDFVSRYFAPSYGIPEDPVTGSTHCSLAPYWSEKLGKSSLHARQVSQRGGELWCELRADRVIIKGNAVLTLRGQLTI
ncbi:MAG: phenazine biosynthesis protein PhzF family [Candidatus Sulfotelmatobacter sp.]|nr:phenazine biosynthesis protein PhzF family [Candidatus Sulfotelmatobacter sp.]